MRRRAAARLLRQRVRQQPGPPRPDHVRADVSVGSSATSPYVRFSRDTLATSMLYTRRVHTTMFVLCLALALPTPRPAAAQADGLRAFTNATVIDGTGEAPLQEATVVTENGRIDCVGDCEVPADATVVDAAGKYIIPDVVCVRP